MEILFLGALMATGFAAGSLAERIGIPRVAAYVAVGALFSEPLGGTMLPAEPGAWVDRLTSAALGIIAFLIGADIDLDSLKKQAGAVAGVVAGQTLAVLALVTLALGGLPLLLPGAFGAGLGWTGAMVLAVLALATAPAATLAIVEEHKAKGKLTTTLLGIVAIDDAIGIVLFTLALGLAGQTPIGEQALHAARELALSLAAGGIAGAALGWFGRRLHEGDLRLPMIVAAILLNTGLAEALGYSDLLSNIVMGFVAMLVFRKPQAQWVEPMGHVRDTIFLLFFTLAGTHFDPAVFAGAAALIAVYIATRFAGKVGGAWGGAALAGADDEVRRWAGLALMPQAGVAIGLALRARNAPGLEAPGPLLLNVIIGSTLVFALIAPLLTRFALRKAGDIDSGDKPD